MKVKVVILISVILTAIGFDVISQTQRINSDYGDIFIGKQNRLIIGGLNSSDSIPLPIGKRIYAHFSLDYVVEGKVISHDTIGHPSNYEDKFLCAIIEFDQTSIKPPQYYIATTFSFSKKEGIKEEKLDLKLDVVLINNIREIMETKMPYFLKQNAWYCDQEKIGEEFSQAIKSEKLNKQFDYLNYLINDTTALFFGALKVSDTLNFISNCHSPLVGHEIMGWVVNINTKEINNSFHVGSLTWALGDGNSYLREYLPKEFLSSKIIGVYDVNNDDTLELLLLGVGAESSSIEIMGIGKEKLTDLNIKFSGGL
ncbi:MAG: hypothetical protein COC01_02335 [Bacteroidetes bacterium]|nr:hypothetical protein [Bacteroidia bacterium]PCH69052.1 MAG: hypothetical protein COC01_02335 [Bacteroidota bacterium]